MIHVSGEFFAETNCFIFRGRDHRENFLVRAISHNFYESGHLGRVGQLAA